MIKEAIVKIVSKQDLTYEEAYTVMNEIMSGETTATQNAAFLAALSTKSARAETAEEITGCATAMREKAIPVEAGDDLFEIVGTGGDNAHSFNISTTAALVAAAGGMRVAKHGNRAASSQCGTADCLEALGVNIRQDPDMCRRLLDEAGIQNMDMVKLRKSKKESRHYWSLINVGTGWYHFDCTQYRYPKDNFYMVTDKELKKWDQTYYHNAHRYSTEGMPTMATESVQKLIKYSSPKLTLPTDNETTETTQTTQATQATQSAAVG